MKLDPKFKVEHSCAKDQFRPALNEPYLDTSNSRILATNGHMLAVVPVESIDRDDTSGSVPTEVVKASRKHDGVIKANGVCKTGRVSYDRIENVKFPQVQGIINDLVVRGQGTITFGIDPEKLYSLSKALGVTKGKYVILTIDKPLYAIRVDVKDGDAFGIIMPCSI